MLLTIFVEILSVRESSVVPKSFFSSYIKINLLCNFLHWISISVNVFIHLVKNVPSYWRVNSHYVSCGKDGNRLGVVWWPPSIFVASMHVKVRLFYIIVHKTSSSIYDGLPDLDICFNKKSPFKLFRNFSNHLWGSFRGYSSFTKHITKVFYRLHSTISFLIYNAFLVYNASDALLNRTSSY